MPSIMRRMRSRLPTWMSMEFGTLVWGFAIFELLFTSAPVLKTATQICVPRPYWGFPPIHLGPVSAGHFNCPCIGVAALQHSKKMHPLGRLPDGQRARAKIRMGTAGGRVARVVFNLPPSQPRTVAGRDCSAPFVLWGGS
jgi:hypothetical protein